MVGLFLKEISPSQPMEVDYRAVFQQREKQIKYKQKL